MIKKIGKLKNSLFIKKKHYQESKSKINHVFK